MCNFKTLLIALVAMVFSVGAYADLATDCAALATFELRDQLSESGPYVESLGPDSQVLDINGNVVDQGGQIASAQIIGRDLYEGTAWIAPFGTDTPHVGTFPWWWPYYVGPVPPAHCVVDIEIDLIAENANIPGSDSVINTRIFLIDPNLFDPNIPSQIRRIVFTGGAGNSGGWETFDTGWLLSNYVVLKSDIGHFNQDVTWRENPFESVDEYDLANYDLGVHLSTVFAKQIIEHFYNVDNNDLEPDNNYITYFSGCSAGGKMGAIATMHPFDFDGIQANAPAITTAQGIAWLKIVTARGILNGFYEFDANIELTQNSQDRIVSITNYIMEVCDEVDGIDDEIISEPYACKINYQDLRYPLI